MLKISHGGFGLVFIAMRDFFQDFLTHSLKPVLKGSFLMHSKAIISVVKPFFLMFCVRIYFLGTF